MSLPAKFIEVEFGSMKVKFYALTVGQIQELAEEMQSLRGVVKGDDPFGKERFANLLTIYTASAKRGDPNINREQIAHIVDMENLSTINNIVLGLSDTRRASSTDPTSPQTGGESTRAS